MSNEKITTYTPITPLEALKLLVENDGNPVEGLAFGNHRVSSDLVGISIRSNLHFESSQGFYSKCAKVTELDPRNCQEPDAFEEFCEAWALDSLQYASPKWFKEMMRQAYELGQANPKKVK